MSKASSSTILHLLRRVAQDQLPDEQLLRQFRERGDEACFHALLRRHGPMVLALCRSMLRSEADAEDAFQATFLVLAKQARAVRKQASLASWLHGVAYRTCLRARADFARRRRHESQAAPLEATVPADPAWVDYQRVLHEELDRLRERYRAPLVLCYLQGATQDEAALRLGLPKGTLKGRLERGRALLRARLVKRGLGPAAVLAAATFPHAASASLPLQAAASVAKAATLVGSGASAAGVVSESVIHLSEGMVRAMFIAKIRVLALGFVVCLGAFAFAMLATGQAPQAPKIDEPAKQAKGDPGKALRLALPPEALANHLGVNHASFELSYDTAPAELSLSIDVYENGKLSKQGEKFGSLPRTKKHACSVLFSRRPGEARLLLTIVTPSGTSNLVIDDPFPDPGQFFPGPRLDVKERIPLALRLARKEGAGLGLDTLSPETAEIALVVQVHRK